MCSSLIVAISSEVSIDLKTVLLGTVLQVQHQSLSVEVEVGLRSGHLRQILGLV